MIQLAVMQTPLARGHVLMESDRNHKLWNIESTERYISRHCWNVATYKWKVHTGKIEIVSFVVVSLTAPHSISSHRSSYEADLSVSVVSFISTSMG
jgi:hypothetical protein